MTDQEIVPYFLKIATDKHCIVLVLIKQDWDTCQLMPGLLLILSLGGKGNGQT